MKNILQLYICDLEEEGIYGLIIEREADFVATFVKKKTKTIIIRRSVCRFLVLIGMFGTARLMRVCSLQV